LIFKEFAVPVIFWRSWMKRRLLSKKRHPRRSVNPLSGLQEWLLEDRCLLSGGLVASPNVGPQSQVIYVGTNPYQITTVSKASDVLFLGGTANGQDWGDVPQKLFTITNNSSDKQTIYPFLYTPNNSQLYDPIDANNQEYREYIGYTQNGKTYLGLPYGKSITINVPLVFWNGGRADIAIDEANLIPTPNNVNTLNPFQFYYNSTMYVGSDGVISSTDKNGVILYYRENNPGNPHDPNPAAAGQLIEWTIRDKDFLTKVNTYDQQNNIGTIPSSELTTLINYDVSYVDDLIAPVAMEATRVPVPIQYVQSGNATSSVSHGVTTTTIQLQNDATLAFLLRLLTTQPDSETKPTWQVNYNVPNSDQIIPVGTVTNVDSTKGIVIVVMNGTVTGLPTGLAGYVFYTNSVTKDYGWTGAQNDLQTMQKVVKGFTTNNPNAESNVNGLGQYFGGLGWPTYYNPSDNLLKIPSGANILVNSPLTNKRSPYDQFYYLLTSNGGVRTQYDASATLSPPNQDLNAGSTVTYEVNTNGPSFTPRVNASNFPGIPVTPATGSCHRATGSCHRGPRADASL
jgi:hypothetical protein